MSLPELRCIQCDRVLLNEAANQPAERCLQCGKLTRVDGPSDELPEAIPVVQPVPRMLKPVKQIPVVQSRSSAPSQRPLNPPPAPAAVPVVNNWPELDTPPTPKPRYGCAILIVLAFVFLTVLAVTFIVYAIARGLRKAPKNEPTPTKLVDTTPTKPTERDPGRPGPAESLPTSVPMVWIPPHGAFPLRSTLTDASLEVPLPGVTPYGVAAGGGRFLLLPCPTARLISVFDVSTAALVGFLPMADPNALVAGSLHEAFVWSPNSRRLNRFDLATLKLERAERLDDRLGQILAIAAGSSARGPFFLLASKQGQPKLHLFNTDTLTEIEWNPEITPFKKPFGIFTAGLPAERAYLRVAANGRIAYGGATLGTQNYRVDRIEMFASTPRVSPTSISLKRPAFPTADGGASAFESEPRSTRFPMTEGSGWFEFAEKAGGTVLTMNFIGEGHVQRAEVKGVDDFARDNGPEQDRRAFLIPSAQALVYLREGGTSLRWRRVKIGEELTKLTQDYLIVTSTPTPVAAMGKNYEYEPRILSNTGATEFKLDAAPPGMKIEGNKLVWPVPADFPDADVAVELLAESRLKPGVAMRQRFTIRAMASEPSFAAWVAPKPLLALSASAIPSTNPNDELAWTPIPPTSVNRGTTLLLKLALTSPETTVLTLIAGPAEAKLEKNELVWNVPKDAPRDPMPIVVRAQTKSGLTASIGVLVEIKE